MGRVGLAPDIPPHAPLLWGDWRCINDRFYTAWCPACGGSLWLHRRGFDDWRASCENDCSREAMNAAAEVLLTRQRHELHYAEEREKTMDPDDRLAGIAAEFYIEALKPELKGTIKRGFYRCPFHEEKTPSLHASGTVWHCFGCGKGGTVYDFGAEVYGIEPRHEGFVELRERLRGDLLKGAAIASGRMFEWPS